MAQFTSKDSTTLTSTMWPNGLPIYVKGGSDIAALHSTGQLVPTHEDALRAWCFVATNTDDHDKTRNKVLAHCGNGDDDLREVAVRFQGFVKHAELGIYGTWDGKRDNAMKAVQALTLVGGVAREVFALQVQGANMIRRFIVEELHGQYAVGKNVVNQLELSQYVFTKVRSHEARSYHAPSDLSKNLTSQASKIQHEWHALGGVRIGVQEQNLVRPATGREIRRGDFVDVTATFSIHQRRRFNATHTYVNFKPVRVIRLATATLIKELCIANTSENKNTGVDNADSNVEVRTVARKIVPADDEL